MKDNTKRFKGVDQMILDWLEPHIGDERISSIDRDALDELRTIGVEKEGWSHSTVDRYMCLVCTILKACADDWRLLPKAPKVPMFNPPVKEPRWLSRDEWARLKAELPPHLQLAAELAILTGLRMRSMLANTDLGPHRCEGRPAVGAGISAEGWA